MGSPFLTCSALIDYSGIEVSINDKSSAFTMKGSFEILLLLLCRIS